MVVKMNITEIAKAIRDNKISLLQARRKLDALGYTFREIRQIITGAIHARCL